MLGLGLAALDVERAKDCLNQYLLPEDDPYAAFVEHGTPLPIQAELPMEIWQRATDREWLAEMLPSYATSTSGSGYWNGAVWMPHNVMIWKALREQGKSSKHKNWPQRCSTPGTGKPGRATTVSNSSAPTPDAAPDGINSAD